jgi:hypothetical protein
MQVTKTISNITLGQLAKTFVLTAIVTTAGIGMAQTRDVWVGLIKLPQIATSEEVRPVAVTATPVAIPESQPRRKPATRTLRIKLTLDTPSDLKVRQGDEVSRGQVMSDRVSVRNGLLTQQQLLLLNLEELKRSASPARSEVVVTTYPVEQVRIEIAKFKMELAKRAIADFWAELPFTQQAWQTLPLREEKAQLKGLQRQLAEAQIELKMATAQFREVQEKNRNLSQPKPQRDTTVQQAQVLAELNELKGKLATQGVVRSGYDGVVKKIKWLGQADQELQVELSVAVPVQDEGGHEAFHE